MTSSGDDRGEVHRVSARAMELMAAHDVPPTPENYAVWYTYCLGNNPALSRSLDILITNKTPFTPDRNAEIYQEFFDTRAYAQAVESTGAQLAAALGRVQELMERTGRDTSAYGTRMSDLSGTLDDETQTLAQIRETVAEMVRETRAILAKNERLEQRLKESKDEVTALRRDLESVRRDALTDALTGAANRKQFDQRLRDASATAMENGEPLALILLDIDHFKKFNDQFGHEMGDEVLKLVARHLIDHVKGRDLPARFGGEEFAVILPETPLKHAHTLADRIRDDLANRRVTNRATHEIYDRVTVSAGVAAYRFGEPLDRLVRRVDAALYAAKRAGRNCVRAETVVADGRDAPPGDRAGSG
jgi:diguanylate cyclase